ncbi:hypothetical protein ATY81_03650 [Rhizobium sp. R72]|nr:hypothetical protein ATY81_03650 [Rhizobium sp. R72]OWW06122.1 hypothetical protein ATY80_03650 [Rhizobium sp. R711]
MVMKRFAIAVDAALLLAKRPHRVHPITPWWPRRSCGPRSCPASIRPFAMAILLREKLKYSLIIFSDRVLQRYAWTIASKLD